MWLTSFTNMLLNCQMQTDLKSNFALFIWAPRLVHPFYIKCNSFNIFKPIPHVKGTKSWERVQLSFSNMVQNFIPTMRFSHIVSKVLCFIAMVNIQALRKKLLSYRIKSWNTSKRWGFPYSMSELGLWPYKAFFQEQRIVVLALYTCLSVMTSLIMFFFGK